MMHKSVSHAKYLYCGTKLTLRPSLGLNITNGMLFYQSQVLVYNFWRVCHSQNPIFSLMTSVTCKTPIITHYFSKVFKVVIIRQLKYIAEENNNKYTYTIFKKSLCPTGASGRDIFLFFYFFFFIKKKKKRNHVYYTANSYPY